MRYSKSKMMEGIIIALILGLNPTFLLAEEEIVDDQGTESVQRAVETVEGTRARIADDTFDNQKVAAEVRTVLSSVVSSALDGDMAGYLKYLTTSDRDRFKEQESVTQIQPVSETWKKDWEAQYQKNLKDTLRQVASMPLKVNSTGVKTAQAVLDSADGRLAFNLDRGGWFDTSWRVNISDSTTKEAVAQGLQKGLRSISTISAATAEESAQKIAYHLLQPLASSQM